ncbi:Ribonuclease CAF1 [Corchorus olitorius]|uniref:poly(A)-specific ribonuclease n=2 Tax=Corchorus olitorius TaxID=93759 RepID=A0A1R3HZF9_9ROSI|nr:Ribonuclease CAF1 [Corchorus olitorius]
MAVRVVPVYRDNLNEELRRIKDTIARCPFVSIDTEFPGTVYKPETRPNPNDAETNYQYMKANVDALKIIQLGLTLSDAQGKERYVWEFNFRDFDIDQDLYAEDSIKLLEQQGINFEKNKGMGIDSKSFASRFWITNLVFNPSLFWVTFHGAYDFGYLLKILTGQNLPSNLTDFKRQLFRFFGSQIFDIKHTVYRGLERVAESLGVDRVAGLSHQAGSDSLLTLDCFMKLRGRGYFLKDSQDHGKMVAPLGLYGLVSNPCWRPLTRWLPPPLPAAVALRHPYPPMISVAPFSKRLPAAWQPYPMISVAPFSSRGIFV